MKNEKLDNDLEDFDFLYEETEPLFHKDIMVQKIENRRTLILPVEISKRKKMIKKMFDARFGKQFFKFKPEALEVLENRLKKYYFSPHSEFLYNFPKLRKKFLYKKNINFDELSSKINVGTLLYLNETEKKKSKKEMLNKNEKMITFSKNFETKATKDVINNEVFKVKFWNKNSKRIKRLLSKKTIDNKKSLNDDSINDSEEEEEEQKDDDIKLYSHTSTNFHIKNNDSENEQLILNKFSSYENSQKKYTDFYNDDLHNTIDNNISQNIFGNPNNLDKKIIQNNTIKKPYMNNLKLYSINKPMLKNKNINQNIMEESSFPSLTVNTNINNSINNNNSNKLFSRNQEINKFHKNTFRSTYKSFNQYNKNKLIDSSLKYKKNLNKQIKDLNFHTIKCNSKLYKLIDGNFIENSKEIIKKKNADFDIGNDLYDKDKKDKERNANKTFFDYYEYERLKARINDNNNINSLIKEVKNNISEENKFKKRELKLFPKKIFKIKDDYALELVERLFSAHKISKEKSPKIKEVVKEEREKKYKKKINDLRKKTKFNNDKIIRMGIFLTKEKDRFFAINKKSKK